jgi:pyridoxine 5'-phosphate synthase PdxJ
MPEVKIRIEKGVETAGDGQELQEKSSKQMTSGKVASVSILATTAIKTVKQVTNTAIANIGNFTGDYEMQRQVQAVMKIGGEIGQVALATLVNPIAGVAMAVGIGLNYGLQAIEISQNIKKENYQASYLLARSGNSLTDGSRGTND